MDRLPRKKEKLKLNLNVINIIILLVGFTAVAVLIIYSPINKLPKKSINSLSSYELVSEKNKIYLLSEVDGYYLGRGFLNGKSIYVFQTINRNILSDLYILPTEDVTVITNMPKNQLIVSSKIYENQQLNSKTQKMETHKVIKNTYIIHLRNNKIKDYGVIEHEKNRFVTFIPFFFFH